MDFFLPDLPAGAADRFSRLLAARQLLTRVTAEPLSVSAVAQRSGMSPFYFSRQFHAAFGDSPGRFSAQAKLRKAQHLLRTTPASVTEICFECGYESLGSFSALFHRWSGCSPREYRRRHGHSKVFTIPFCPPVRPFCLLEIFGGGR